MKLSQQAIGWMVGLLACSAVWAQQAPMPASSATTPNAPPLATAEPGGGLGMVWVNTDRKVYYCQNDPWYGRTLAGFYMSEADARAKHYLPSHGPSCPQ